MGGAASFLNPEPIAEFTDVVAVGEGEILVPKLVDLLFENAAEGGTKEDLLLKLARVGRGFYVPSLYEVTYKPDGTVEAYTPKAEGVPASVGRIVAAENPKEGSLRRAMRRGDTEIVARLKEPEVFAPSTIIWAPEAEMGERFLIEISRGCSQGCRFCWAGFNYWPPRVVPARDILAKAAEWRATHGQDRARLDGRLRPPRDQRYPQRPARDGLQDLGLVSEARPDRGRIARRARRVGRPADSGRARDGERPPAPRHQQEPDQRRDRGHLRRGLRPRHAHRQALHDGRAADRDRRRPRSDGRAGRAHQGQDARSRARGSGARGRSSPP